MTGLSAYPTLRKTVQTILSEGRIRAARAVERQKVATYWEVGRVIGDHLLEEKDRADYGDQTIKRLAEDTGLSVQIYYECMKFHRQFPALQTYEDLGWSHYREVFALKSPEQQTYYLQQASENRWTVRQLQNQVRSNAYDRRLPGGSGLPLPEPIRGRLHTYTVSGVNGSGTLSIDLGFSIEQAHPSTSAGRSLASGDLVTSVRDQNAPEGHRLEPSTLDTDLRYTYRADLIRIVDGDTLRVRADLGFGIATRVTVRLRGINAPERKSEEGEAAKRFVEESLANIDRLAIRTYWRGRYGRYLADIFYLPGETDAQTIANDGTYLNAELVQQGHAIVVE